MISKYFDKKNLHHAYLIEGEKKEILPQILKLMEDLEIPTLANPDFSHISIDSFKIDDARFLKSLGNNKSFSKGHKKIFIISTNNFLLEAQNALLKSLEDPIENTHFFIIMPDTASLLPTFISRCFYIKAMQEKDNYEKEVENFIKMSFQNRIEFIKELLIETKDMKDDIFEKSIKIKMQEFLNSLESNLYSKMSKGTFDIKENVLVFKQIFKARKFLRQPGSSVKSLMESVALSIPEM